MTLRPALKIDNDSTARCVGIVGPLVEFWEEHKMARPDQRDKIVRATAALLRRRGYAATGLAEITAESGAPKGSLYHYFPGGKDQIAVAALRHAGEKVAATLTELAQREASAAGMLRAYGGLLAGWMAQSGFQDGCPVTTTLLETAPQKPEIVQAGQAAFSAWAAPLADRLVADGIEPERARSLARFALMAIGGALVFARVEASAAPLLAAAEEAARLFERETG